MTRRRDDDEVLARMAEDLETKPDPSGKEVHWSPIRVVGTRYWTVSRNALYGSWSAGSGTPWTAAKLEARCLPGYASTSWSEPGERPPGPPPHSEAELSECGGHCGVYVNLSPPGHWHTSLTGHQVIFTGVVSGYGRVIEHEMGWRVGVAEVMEGWLTSRSGGKLVTIHVVPQRIPEVFADPKSLVPTTGEEGKDYLMLSLTELEEKVVERLTEWRKHYEVG